MPRMSNGQESKLETTRIQNSYLHNCEFGVWIHCQMVCPSPTPYKFQAETLPEAPYVTIAYDDSNYISLGGLWGDIWQGMLEKMLNFSTKIMLSPDRQWGSLGENGTRNGIVSRLMNIQSQVGLASFIQTESRMEVLDLSPALTEGADRMFIKYPGRGTSWTTFIEPFDFYLWSAIICLIVITIFCLFATYAF